MVPPPHGPLSQAGRQALHGVDGEDGSGGQRFLSLHLQGDLEGLTVVDVGVVEQAPVLGQDRVLTLDVPLHDDVGGRDVVHVVAHQGQVVDVPGDTEDGGTNYFRPDLFLSRKFPVDDDLCGDRLDVGVVKLGLPLTEDGVHTAVSRHVARLFRSDH